MKLNTKRTILVGLAFLSICSFWQLYDSIIPLILKNTFAVSDTVSGIVMAMDNVLAIFLLPLFGALSDRTHTRLGRRTPFILIGTACAVVSMMLIPVADLNRILVLFIAALGCTLLSMGLYRSPAVALMPDVTPKPLRSKANAIINLMGAVGGVITLGLIRFLVPSGSTPNYIPLFACVAGIMVVSVVVLVCTVRENRAAAEAAAQNSEEPVPTDEPAAPAQKTKLAPDVRRSMIFLLASVAFWFMGYNAVTTAFSRYAQIQWGMEGGGFANCLMVATVAAVISYIPVGWIATRFGRKKTILGGVALLALCFGAGALITAYHAAVNILFALVGVAWAFINVNSYPMVVEMGHGSDVGRFTGLYYTFSMAAQIITPILSGVLLDHIGYGTLFPYAAVCVVIAFITMTQVRHGDSKPLPPKSKLEAFDTPD
ncbi:MAG: MFS transporter [Firmicutes bacterium]|nr:MFS transporter [Bacillota bacterium]